MFNPAEFNFVSKLSMMVSLKSIIIYYYTLHMSIVTPLLLIDKRVPKDIE